MRDRDVGDVGKTKRRASPFAMRRGIRLVGVAFVSALAGLALIVVIGRLAQFAIQALVAWSRWPWTANQSAALCMAVLGVLLVFVRLAEARSLTRLFADFRAWLRQGGVDENG
jgi:hypothetical protein